MGSKKMMSMVVVVMAVIMSWTSVLDAQKEPTNTSCFQSLIPCASFFNSTNPPATCCEPLKVAFNTQLKCLCDAFKNPAILAAANVTVSQALDLAKRCDIDAHPSDCDKLEGQAPTSAPGATKSTPQDNNAGSSVGPISSLLLLLVGFMFY